MSYFYQHNRFGQNHVLDNMSTVVVLRHHCHDTDGEKLSCSSFFTLVFALLSMTLFSYVHFFSAVCSFRSHSRPPQKRTDISKINNLILYGRKRHTFESPEELVSFNYQPKHKSKLDIIVILLKF
jgi:hypothetical protein